MNVLVNSLSFLTLVFGVALSQAQPISTEMTCRAKAKEIAAQAYNSCVTDTRNAQVDQIRKDYEKQLAALKAKYDKELKKIGGKPVSDKIEKTDIEKPITSSALPAKVKPKSKATKSASTGSTPKAAKGVAKSLPTRNEVKNPAPPVQEVHEETAVAMPEARPVAPGFEEDLPSQNEASEDLQIQLVPASGSSATAEPDTY